ncbi:hypothetical protein ISCGN_003181 [Ixodes scapularis]
MEAAQKARTTEQRREAQLRSLDALDLEKTDSEMELTTDNDETRQMNPANHRGDVRTAAAGPASRNEPVKAPKILLQPAQNLVTLSTPSLAVATEASSATTLTVDGKTYPLKAYIASPENTVKVVIHGIKKNTSPEELFANTRVGPNFELVYGRMLGSSETALLTFQGQRAPRQVIYQHGIYECRKYTPLRQICSKCHELGHRADICPRPDVNLCKVCGQSSPRPPHHDERGKQGKAKKPRHSLARTFHLCQGHINPAHLAGGADPAAEEGAPVGKRVAADQETSEGRSPRHATPDPKARQGNNPRPRKRCNFQGVLSQLPRQVPFPTVRKARIHQPSRPGPPRRRRKVPLEQCTLHHPDMTGWMLVRRDLPEHRGLRSLHRVLHPLLFRPSHREVGDLIRYLCPCWISETGGAVEVTGLQGGAPFGSS